MDGLRTSVGLRAYGQKDPLIEYKQEAFTLFQDLMGLIKSDITSNLFKSSAAIMEIQKMLASIPQKLIHESIDQPHTSIGSVDGEASQQSKPSVELTLPIRRQGPKLGRNDACPVDPSKKFKNCCGASGEKYCTKVAL